MIDTIFATKSNDYQDDEYLPAALAKLGTAADNLLEGDAALAFALAGKAILTLHNEQSDVRYTYRLSRPEQEPGDTREPPVFVSLLSGPDNTSDYRYIGTIFSNDPTVCRATRKSTPSLIDSLAHKGIEWLFRQLLAHKPLPDYVKLYHSGRCGRCGRLLTTPESVKRGIGPECIKHI